MYAIVIEYQTGLQGYDGYAGPEIYVVALLKCIRKLNVSKIQRAYAC